MGPRRGDRLDREEGSRGAGAYRGDRSQGHDRRAPAGRARDHRVRPRSTQNARDGENQVRPRGGAGQVQVQEVLNGMGLQDRRPHRRGL